MTKVDDNKGTGRGSRGHAFPVCVFLFLLVASFPVPGVDAQKDRRLQLVEVETKSGRIRGERLEATAPDELLATKRVTGVYERFLGIPYAKPPLGHLRFAAPEPMEPWSGVIDTLDKKPSCPQPVYEFEIHYINQNEDCLYLNVFSPYDAAKEDKRYPVMLYIHGGSFESGSGHVYDGKILSSMGVVVVTINYRLGALGFLTSGDDILPGNYGVRDQLAAMRWVKENIHFLRGDPNRIALVGHSVGASSVGLMMTIREARGLYHVVIAQSGSASALYSCYNNSFSGQFKEYIRKVGQLLNCPMNNSFSSSSSSSSSSTSPSEREEVIKIRDCLRSKDIQVFMDKRIQFPLYDRMGVEFRPYVDGELIVRDPRESFRQGAYNKVPFFTGIVEREFNFYFEQATSLESERPDAIFEQYLLRSFNNNKDIVRLIRFQYATWSATESNSDLKYDKGEVLSDFHMVAPTIQLADIISTHQKEVYNYYFRHPLSYHSIELSYLFGTPFGAEPADEMGKINHLTSTDQDKGLSLYIMEQWASIAATGRPSDIGGVHWPNYSREERVFLNMSLEGIGVSRNLRSNRAFFWNEILPMVFPDSRQVLGSGLTSFDKYPSAIEDFVVEVEDKKRRDFRLIVILSVGLVVSLIVVLVLVGCLARLKIEMKELKKVAKLYSVSYAV